MKYISAILRIGCGAAVMALAGYVYLVARDQIASGREHAVLFGQELNLRPDVLLWLMVGAGVVGLIFVIHGLVTVLTKS